MPDSPTLIDVLLAGGRRAERATHIEHIPGREAQYAPWPKWADPALVAGYGALGVERPWRHQVEAASSAWARTHTAIGTSTGSGKSLAYWLPALTSVRAGSLARDKGRIESVRARGSVLYLCPTKALAADQLAGLHRLLVASEITDVAVSTCDGDTPFSERKWIQDHADVVLTNPDLLHFSLLPNHARWVRFLRNLRYVIIDEGHSYRGVFGAHVALVLRRLRRLAEHYSGHTPTFIVASATTADPAQSAGRLISVPPEQVRAVVEDTSPAGRKTFVLWQPPQIPPPTHDDGSGLGAGDVEHAEGAGIEGATGDQPDVRGRERRASIEGFSVGADQTGEDEWWIDAPAPVEHPRRTATAEAAEILADFTSAGARTLAFTRSRRGAETVALGAQRALAGTDPALRLAVAAYRGGYLPEERRALESALRTGTLRGLATTNALELGVDISGLDAVLIIGWPGTRMSVWQQAGRAGRAGAEGLVVFIAREDPLDTYLVQNPEAIFAAPLEATVFDPNNPHVLAPHLCAAASELPIRSDEMDLFGPHAPALLDELVTRGALRQRPTGWYWIHPQSAAAMTDLRGSGGQPVRVVEASTGRMLGTVDASGAPGAVHDGAVYIHQGATFVVNELNLTEHVALVTRRDVDYGTWSRDKTNISIIDTSRERSWGPIGWGLGSVEVSSQVINYQKRRLPGLEVLATVPLDLPEQILPSMAVWWTVPADVLSAAGVTPDLAPGALHAAEHAAIGLLPLLATCDRWDLGGVSTAMHMDTGEATVFVYDAYPGGAGFAERGYELGATWLRATRDAIAACPCAAGCPACVQSPKCGNQNNPLEKTAAIRLLDAVLEHEPTGAPSSE